jgi:hypothetical protein
VGGGVCSSVRRPDFSMVFDAVHSVTGGGREVLFAYFDTWGVGGGVQRYCLVGEPACPTVMDSCLKRS